MLLCGSEGAEHWRIMQAERVACVLGGDVLYGDIHALLGGLYGASMGLDATLDWRKTLLSLSIAAGTMLDSSCLLRSRPSSLPRAVKLCPMVQCCGSSPVPDI